MTVRVLVEYAPLRTLSKEALRVQGLYRSTKVAGHRGRNKHWLDTQQQTWGFTMLKKNEKFAK